MKYSIRFNKSRGQPGRGSVDHVWRVFEDDKKEYLVKHVKLNVKSWSEQDSSDWNICCEGAMVLDRTTSTAIFVSHPSEFINKKH